MAAEHLTVAQFRELLSRHLGSLPVSYDFADAQPYWPHSYRGWPSQLAINWEPIRTDQERTTVARLSNQLRWATCTEHEGYKGGSFWIGPASPLWAAEYGQWDGRAVVGVEERDGTVVILTRAPETEDTGRVEVVADNGATEAALEQTIEDCRAALETLHEKHRNLYEQELLLRAECRRAGNILWGRPRTKEAGK